MSDHSTIKEFIAAHHFRAGELLPALHEAGLLKLGEGFSSLFQISKAGGFGLASDGYWYSAEQNEDVKRQCQSGDPTMYAVRWLRSQR